MFGRNYYCLVAGLREYTLESEKKGFDAPAIVDEIREELSAADRKAMELFYGFCDVENIISLHSGRSRFNAMGNFSREELEEEMKQPRLLPSWLAEVLEAYREPESTETEGVDTSLTVERSLYEAYYRECSRSSCRFLREWAEFDRTLRNVCAALTAREKGLPAGEQLVGGGDVVDALKRSSAADFGLKGEVEYIDRVVAAVDTDADIVEKEHRIDMIRWDMSEELAAQDYFNINTILSYLVKINLVQRWAALDSARGREMYEKLVASFDGRELIRKAEEINNKQ